ncbi:hypothetical protein JV213_06415, partial [Plesiomonas shigelloides]|uniref:hypothetical protein n=1 Tax=Plesiomonas shigelloides TaxID=703 RepID=UPI001C03CE77
FDAANAHFKMSLLEFFVIMELDAHFAYSKHELTLLTQQKQLLSTRQNVTSGDSEYIPSSILKLSA